MLSGLVSANFAETSVKNLKNLRLATQFLYFKSINKDFAVENLGQKNLRRHFLSKNLILFLECFLKLLVKEKATRNYKSWEVDSQKTSKRQPPQSETAEIRAEHQKKWFWTKDWNWHQWFLDTMKVIKRVSPIMSIQLLRRNHKTSVSARTTIDLRS